MNDYQERIAADQAQLLDMLEAIAAHLDGWKPERKYDHGARLINDDGVTVWVRRESYGASSGRLSLSAGQPDGASYSEGDTSRLDCPRITVDPTRDPATLARDITRRLLPAAVDYWTAVQERITRRLSAANARETLARELADIMGSSAREARGGRGDWEAELPAALRHTDTYTYGDMTPNHDAAAVTVEMRNVPADRARELARLVATWAQ